MRRASLTVACVSALTLWLGVAPGWAQPGSPTDAKKSEEQAMAVVKRMAEFLSRAPRFSVTVEIGFDVVQELGLVQQ